MHRFDLIIRGGEVIDGTRAPRFAADVGVRDGRIAAVGRLDDARADREIDATGRIVAPGFIDAHTHDDRMLLSGPDMIAKASQGVTTVVTGNCGVSLAPLAHAGGAPTPPLDLLDDSGGWFRFPTFGGYLETLAATPAALNFAPLIGHTTLRVATMSALNRPATPTEIGRMQAMVREAVGAGAIGLSSGTFYEPAAAAPTEEVIEVARPVGEARGLYVTHMRNEADRIIDALDETFLIGRTLGIKVVISHHKIAGVPNHGRSAQTLAHIAAHMRSQPIGLDCYPYCASSTILSWSRAKQATKVLVTWSKPHPEVAGQALDEIAARFGLSAEETIKKLVPAGGIYFQMDEADVQRILSFDHTMIGSDGLPHDAAPHPRLWGTFPRVLGHYSRGMNLFPLETAVHKMTGLTAQTFGFADRGVVKVGAHADLTIFNASTVDEAATFTKPIQPARGIDTVIVNGVPVWANHAPTGARPGQRVRRIT